MTTNKPPYEMLERANNAKAVFNKQLSDQLHEKQGVIVELHRQLYEKELEIQRLRKNLKVPSLFSRLKILFTGEL